MTHRFDMTTLNAVRTAECDPGFYLQLSTSAGPARSILKLNSGNPAHFFYVDLSGDEPFRLTFRNMLGVGDVALISLSSAPEIIELPDKPDLTSDREKVGAILVCKEGTYLIAHRLDERGQTEVNYVSLKTLIADECLPSDKYGVFETWRLTTSEANPSERTVLASNGEWPQ